MQSTLSDAEGNILYRATLTYDGQNRLESFRERAGEEAHRTEFHYDKDSRVTQMDYDTDKGKVEYSYDSLGRIATRKVTNGRARMRRRTRLWKGRRNTERMRRRRWSRA